MDDTDTVYDRGERSSVGTAETVLTNVVDPVFMIADETITYANPAARRVLELPADVVGTHPADSLGDRWATLAVEINEMMIGTVTNGSLEVDGYSTRIHRGEDGATIILQQTDGADPADVDRTVKTRAIDEAPVGFSLTDPSMEDNPLVYVNAAYERLTGYSADDVLGNNCRLLQGPDTDPMAVSAMRAGIEEERPVTVEVKNYRKDGTPFWNEVTIAPVRDETGEPTHYVGFQNEITARKEAEFALQERTEELEYILERLEGLLQDVTTAVAGSTSRSDLEERVCQRLVAESAYDGAWVGERNPATDTVEVRASAGRPVDSVPMDTPHPVTESLETSAVVVESVDGSTIVAFPLVYNGVEYGTLTVSSPLEREISERERIIMSALTRAVASGINARETSRMLATDSVVAVELTITDPALAPVAISEATGGRLEYRRSVHRTGDDTASLFTVSGVDGATLLEFDGETTLDVLVEREDRTLVELSSDDDIVSWLSERGINVRSIVADDGSASITLEIPHSTNVRSVVEAVQSRYDGTDVLSFRQQERTGETSEEFAANLDAALTERQFASLQRAYLGGYFEWPRPTTGEELAQSMDVSRPTFHEHLRSAEAKLCQAFFGDDSRLEE